MTSPDDILRILDVAAESFWFPTLDNGYIYLAATRLSLYRSEADWALVIEVFGYSPRAGLPDLQVYTFASRLRDRDPPENFARREHYDNYLLYHPHDDSRFFHPIAEGDWQDEESNEVISEDADVIVLRDEPCPVPSADELSRCGIALLEPPRIQVFEVCRFLADKYRDRVLATPEERRVSVPPELTEILRLEEWSHPDLAGSEPPSESECFQQLARVLSSGDIAEYRPTAEPNTHWSNWPDGGSL